MSDFTIEAHRVADAGADDPQSIVIRWGDTVFTQLVRPAENKLEDSLNAPPSHLAFWLLDNWWRLRFECVPWKKIPAEWRLAHEMTSIGGGFAWPRLRIWGEGERVGLASKSDPEGVVGPVRYVTDALIFIAGKEFESAVDQFLALAADRTSGFGSDRDALQKLVKVLSSERADSQLAQWRRLEAQLGFDPDEAPEPLIRAVGQLSERYGDAGIEEAVQAHPGIEAANVLRREIEITENKGWECDFAQAVHFAGSFTADRTQPPWKIAPEFAQRVRRAVGVTSGLVQDSVLAQLADIDPRAIQAVTSGSRQLEYGLRLRAGNGRTRVAFRTRTERTRRFELGRAIGDAIWGAEALGPLADTNTARQKFQRAFAQNLLCPFDELMTFLETSSPTDDDIADAAQNFSVSEGVIHTILMNNNVIERESHTYVEAA